MSEKVANSQRVLGHFVRLGLIDEEKARSALSQQRAVGGDVLDALLDLSLIGEQDLARGLASLYRIPLVNLTRIRVTKQALSCAHGEFCRHHQVLPFAIDGATEDLLVATHDPSRLSAVDALRYRTGKEVRLYVAARTQLRDAIEFFYFDEASRLQRPSGRTATTTPARAVASPPDTEPPRPDDRDNRPPASAPLPDREVSGRLSSGSLAGSISDVDLAESQRPPTDEPVPAGLGTDQMSARRAGFSGQHSDVMPLVDAPSGSLETGALGQLNPFAEESVTQAELRRRIKQLEATVAKLDKALRYEMRVSQALAEVLVENGLISSEQLKTRLRQR